MIPDGRRLRRLFFHDAERVDLRNGLAFTRPGQATFVTQAIVGVILVIGFLWLVSNVGLTGLYPNGPVR